MFLDCVYKKLRKEFQPLDAYVLSYCILSKGHSLHKQDNEIVCL